MRCSLIIGLAVTEAIAAMPEVPHELFTLECLAIGRVPFGGGAVVYKTAGALTTCTRAVGSMGLIEYEVDENDGVVTITSVISMF
ncbi:hypothetical protein Caci_2120 [Catenulispora acidiphila DSM 44928]|uniref:Uncharacterized protein n=1 Tax=Catenulispora acidiphila (strain DSM 44928 / JCM 14897 / NBRC 102108 / NRRL B-24433 / ID139908) TaxID=479433 RepID=C7QHL4_CATAD|nr:hypothetical protein Caci_2120 [Catenulispora acidiphila DSM 44928]